MYVAAKTVYPERMSECSCENRVSKDGITFWTVLELTYRQSQILIVEIDPN
jgi:hypothetical protein